MASATDEPAPDRRQLMRLLQRQALEAQRFGEVFGDAHGLHRTDLAALAAIGRATDDDVPLGPGRLAEALHLSPPATTALVDRLESAGHVRRRADPDDRRRTVLEMQAGTAALAGAFFGRLVEAMDAVMDGYSEAELQTVGHFLDEVVAATVAVRGEVAAEGGGAPARSGTVGDATARGEESG